MQESRAAEAANPLREARATLRFWAVADGIYAALVGALVIVAVPGKSPWLNGIVLGWAALLLVTAPFLWRARRWAYRVAIAASLLGLAGAVLFIVGFVASWAYLRAIYGAFGAGASLASLLIAGMVAEVLGIYPAIRLRALLRWPVRQLMRPGRAAAATVVALAVAPLVVGVVVHERYRLAPVAPVSEGAVAGSLAALRARLAGAREIPALEAVPLAEPIFVSVWERGELRARVAGEGAALPEAIARAAAALIAAGAPAGRLKIDRVIARAPVLRTPELAFALGFDPGLDGLLDAEGRVVFLPDDLLKAGVAGATAPLPALSELRLGVSGAWLTERLARAGARPPLSRVRIESWMETADGAARVYRGNVVRATSTRAAAVAGGDYLLGQIESDGRFRYRHQPYGAAAFDAGEYSLARHAGTAYGLAQLHGETGEARFAEAARGALAWLALQISSCGAAGRACLVERGGAQFGPSALAAIAMFEFERRTGDRGFAELARALAAFLMDRQRADGEFDHGYDPVRAAVVPGPARMFASEQAALALVLADRVGGISGARAAAERALDFLTRKKYDFWLGRFIYGADHWTCIAAEEAWPALQHRHYLDFCRGYAAFMRRLQYPDAPGTAARDFAGHFGFGYQMVPQAPATAGFTEALLSTVALARHHAADARALEADARRALAALAREQLGPHNSYLAADPGRAAGGFRRSLVEPEIRIDFVQHATAALARAERLGLTPL